MKKTIEDFAKEAWGVHPMLNVSGLFPPAVLFSILDSDPRPKFKEALQKLLAIRQQQEPGIESSIDPHLMHQSQLSAAWDSVLHDVPGDRIGLLYGGEERHGADETIVRTSAVMIKSTALPGSKWFVTRAVRLREKAMCWCIPVEVEKGRTTEVALTENNIITLEAQ